MSIEVGEKRILSNTLVANQSEYALSNSNLFGKSDVAELSNNASELKNFPANLSTAKVLEYNEGFSFNFDFDETRYQKVTTDGYYSTKEKKLSMTLKYNLEKILYENGNPKTERFQVEFSINYSDIEINSLERKIEKENIYNFLNRVINDITKVLNDDKKNLAGIIFDKEDLQELMQIGDEEVGKFLNEIILLIQTLAKIKKHKNPYAQSVLFTPKRINQESIETTQSKIQNIDIKMEIIESSE